MENGCCRRVEVVWLGVVVLLLVSAPCASAVLVEQLFVPSLMMGGNNSCPSKTALVVILFRSDRPQPGTSCAKTSGGPTFRLEGFPMLVDEAAPHK